MRKKIDILILATLIGFLLFQIQFYTVTAHDDDDDGVDDDGEDDDDDDGVDDDGEDDEQGISILYILILMLILSASVAIVFYYYFKKKKSDDDRKSQAAKMFNESTEDYLFDPGRKYEILRKFDEIEDITELSQIIGTNLTALSQKFLDKVNKFDWDYDEKKEFIKEMLTLTPEERERILKEMKTRNV